MFFRKSVRALQLAKKHIEEEYSVVGVTEDFNNTFIVLENYIPGKSINKSNNLCFGSEASVVCLFIRPREMVRGKREFF